MFFDFDTDLHTYYLVEDGKVQFMGESVGEAELPQRLKGMIELGVQSAYIFVQQTLPRSVSEWMHSDLSYKQLISTRFMELKPPDSVEAWVRQTRQLMSEKEADFAELSVTIVKE
jgi:hypothetical protein